MSENTWRPHWVDVRELRPCLPTTDIGFWVLAQNGRHAKGRVCFFLMKRYNRRTIRFDQLAVPTEKERPSAAKDSRWLGKQPQRLRRREYNFRSHAELSLGRDN